MDFTNGDAASAEVHNVEKNDHHSFKPVVQANGILPIFLPDDVDGKTHVPTNVQSYPLKVPESSGTLDILVLKEGVKIEQNKMGTFSFVAPPVKNMTHIAERNIRRLFQGLMDHVVAKIEQAEMEAYSWIDEHPNLVAGAMVDSSLVLFPGFLSSPLLSNGNLNDYKPHAVSDIDGNVAFGNAAIGELINDLQIVAAGGAGMSTIQAILTATASCDVHRYGLDNIQAMIANITMGEALPTSESDWQPDAWALDGWFDDDDKPWNPEEQLELVDNEGIDDLHGFLSIIEEERSDLAQEEDEDRNGDVSYNLTLLYGNGDTSATTKQSSDNNTATEGTDLSDSLKWD